MVSEQISSDEKRQALERVLASRTFNRSDQLRALLRYICEAEFEGRAQQLNEYVASGAQQAADPAIPHLEQRGERIQLVVNGEPYLILGGELLNNSATSLEYLEPVWPELKSAHLNTVLAAISWALLERSEGEFDFTLVDGLIRDTRAHDMRLVLLWFGRWKNTWSSYAPDWVKRDQERFPRVHLHDGSGTERLSPFSDANRDADARAFAALMRRVREIDGDKHTVLMIQVENEVGVIPDARDHSPVANAAYTAPVPKALIDYLVEHKETLHPTLRARWQKTGFRTSGNWEEVFGPGLETDDLFMAWHYAKYIGTVTEAGKKEYNLPMFTNAALIRPNYAPGQYNSGGPLAHSIDVWNAGGSQLDFLAPDIYFEFKKWSAEYDRAGNPLFIPEAAGGQRGAAQAYYAIGHHGAMGYSPFGIDRVGRGGDSGSAFSRGYRVLGQLAPLILEHQTTGGVEGVFLEELTRAQSVRLGDYTMELTPTQPRRGPGPGTTPSAAPVADLPYGIFIASGPNEYYMAGSRLNITFWPNTPGPPQAGLAMVEEGEFVDGRWKPGRTLAGDDTGQGNSISLRGDDPGILRVVLYRYR